AGAGAAAFLLFNLGHLLWARSTADFDWRLDLRDGLVWGIFLALLHGLVFGLRRRRGAQADGRGVEALTWTGWSWRSCRRGAALLLLLAPAVCGLNTLGAA